MQLFLAPNWHQLCSGGIRHTFLPPKLTCLLPPSSFWRGLFSRRLISKVRLERALRVFLSLGGRPLFSRYREASAYPHNISPYTVRDGLLSGENRPTRNYLCGLFKEASHSLECGLLVHPSLFYQDFEVRGADFFRVPFLADFHRIAGIELRVRVGAYQIIEGREADLVVSVE